MLKGIAIRISDKPKLDVRDLSVTILEDESDTMKVSDCIPNHLIGKKVDPKYYSNSKDNK